ncbi:MAG: SURF1 family protein [Granulosicoccus sp.]
MRILNRHFSPKLWAVLLYLFLFSCMLMLANWQLNRADLKISLQEAAELAQNASATPIEDIPDLTLAASSYQRVSLQGRYDVARQFLWDNRTHQGQAGFETLVPLVLADGRSVLVNRGWVAPGVSRQQLPSVEMPESVLNQWVSIEGFLSRPSKGFASGPAVIAAATWPKLLQYFDYEAIGLELGGPILPVIVQAQAVGTDAVGVTVLTSRPEWLKANWQPAASGPAKHYSYAFQWFAMALALTILFIVVNTHKIES